MRKKLSIILAIAIIILLAIIIYLCFNQNSQQPVTEKTPIKIGLLGVFSGEIASYGIPMKNAIELAVEQANSQGGINGRKIDLVIEDDTGNLNTATLAMNKLATIDNLDYILSAQGSGNTAAILPIAQDNKKILLITLGSVSGLTKKGEYIFRSVPSDSYQANKMVDYAKNNFQAKKVAVLYINNAYGTGIKDIINANINNVINETFNEGSADFKTQLFKIKQSNPDLLIIAAYNEYVSILKQIRELGLSMPIICSETFKDGYAMAEDDKNMKNLYVTSMKTPQDYVDYTNKYKLKYDLDPSAYSIYAYDGTNALISAIKSGNNEKEKVRQILSSVSFDGASGKFGFDKDRERTGVEYSIYKVVDGQFEIME